MLKLVRAERFFKTVFVNAQSVNFNKMKNALICRLVRQDSHGMVKIASAYLAIQETLSIRVADVAKLLFTPAQLELIGMETDVFTLQISARQV